MHKGQSPTSIESFEAHLKSATVADWARLAAFIDGEGTIYINRRKPSGKRLSEGHTLSVLVTNSSVPLIDWLKSTFGGSVYVKDFHGKNTLGRRQLWTWHLNERQAEVILRGCLPYFIVKREQAVIGLAFRRLKETAHYGAQCGQKILRVPESAVQGREEMRQQIHLLNSPLLTASGA